MNNKPQSRNDKIQLLKDLQRGKISLQELIPETTVVWYCVNGIYTHSCSTDELQLTEAEFKEYTSERPKQRNIIVSLQEGNEPLKEKL